jgi:hypothetical protein
MAHEEGREYLPFIKIAIEHGGVEEHAYGKASHAFNVLAQKHIEFGFAGVACPSLRHGNMKRNVGQTLASRRTIMSIRRNTSSNGKSLTASDDSFR